MSTIHRQGVDHIDHPAWSARILPGPPLIAPTRAFTFPYNVAGEEDALARGALWIDVRSPTHGNFLAQCALGFATGGVAHGLWHLGDRLLAVAGGYAYAIDIASPQATTLLPLRPVVEVLPTPNGATLAGYHAVLVVDGTDTWQSPPVSWEGVTLTTCDGSTLHGVGWDMTTDEEVPFTLDLHARTLHGGGYRAGSPSTASSA